jgi:hypothetical protein
MKGSLPLEWQQNAIDRLSNHMGHQRPEPPRVSAASKGIRHGRR